MTKHMNISFRAMKNRSNEVEFVAYWPKKPLASSKGLLNDY